MIGSNNVAAGYESHDMAYYMSSALASRSSNTRTRKELRGQLSAAEYDLTNQVPATPPRASSTL